MDQGNDRYQPPPGRGYHIFKLRVADLPDKDFIEVEVSSDQISTYDDFLKFCCYEFHIPSTNYVEKIRKLPSTRVRNDADIRRFQTFESFELVLVNPERLNQNK
nr:PREDICTED: uncharacterized protein LOC103313981 isoform X1 [Tribolium castaneum]|eukprot:XP_008196872.1 PREDICTED: uncharacterized protein LOC103313981 isoform X1 [Tribolium castaneum]